MAITTEELPQLIAAAVAKAIKEGQIDQQGLDAMLKKPVTLGMVPQPREVDARAAVSPDSAMGLPIRLGYHFNNLEQLATLTDSKGPEL